MNIYWTTVEDIIEESSEIKTFYLKWDDTLTDFTWSGGAHTHFAMKGFNDGEKPDRGLVRHMSIASLPNEGTIAITTRIKNNCSRYKQVLRDLAIGDDVALFGTSSNMPLTRTNQKLYFFSSGVALATLRPLLLDFLADVTDIPAVHALNVDSTGDYLFTDHFKTVPEKNLTVEYVNSRAAYYERAKALAGDTKARYYIVGSDDFLRQNIALLRQSGVQTSQIMIDKHPFQQAEFL